MESKDWSGFGYLSPDFSPGMPVSQRIWIPPRSKFASGYGNPISCKRMYKVYNRCEVSVVNVYSLHLTGKHAPKGLVANPSRRNPLKMADSRRERKLKEIAEEAERAISSLQNKLKGDKKVRKCHVTDITYNSSGERIVKAPRRPSRSSSSVQSTSTGGD